MNFPNPPMGTKKWQQNKPERFFAFYLLRVLVGRSVFLGVEFPISNSGRETPTRADRDAYPLLCQL